MNRRAFLATGAAAVAATARTPGGLPPPGATAQTLRSRCTACQACVSACRNDVLVTATGEYGWSGLMLPRMSFVRGFCRAECTACGAACPTGAIRPFTVEEKRKLVIGRAVFAKADCLVSKEGLACGNCAVHCPYAAIELKDGGDRRNYPVVDPAKCVGCGACEYHCPSKAIRIQPLKG